MNGAPPPPRICAVCGFPTHTTPDGVYFHPGPDRFDHVVVAVAPEELPNHSVRCDFCYGGVCPWMIWSADFTSGSGETRFRGNWACCDVCVYFVRQQRWSALARRVVESRTSHAPYRVLLDTYGRLSAHMGDVVPMDLREIHKGLPG